eukprot:Skav206900  [mRNA]  locus=scaffold2387:334602:335336:+ [translate_table: standard]
MARSFQQAWKHHRSTTEVVDTIDERVDRLLQVVSDPIYQFSHLRIEESWYDVCYFGQQFTEALLAWSKVLGWPSGFAATTTGVSFMELYMSFRAATGLETPVNIGKPHQHFPTYVMKSAGTLEAFQARAPHQELRVFEYALTYLCKLTGQPLFPLLEVGLTTSLSFLGERKPRTGFKVRCVYPYQQEIANHLLVSISHAKGHWGLDSVAALKLEPLFDSPIRPRDLQRNPATMYEKFRKFLKAR